MFNVTIIKLKDIIKIGVILILIYVFSNFVFKMFKDQKALDNLPKNNSVAFIKKSIEKESSIINNTLKTQNTNVDVENLKEENNKLLDINSFLIVGANIFSLKQNESNGQVENEADKNERYRRNWHKCT